MFLIQGHSIGSKLVVNHSPVENDESSVKLMSFTKLDHDSGTHQEEAAPDYTETGDHHVARLPLAFTKVGA